MGKHELSHHCGRLLHMTRTCVICSAEFTVYDRYRPARTCSPSCSAKLARSKRPPAPHRYRSIPAPGHPLANGVGYVQEHRAVLYAKIGPGTHPCHWCGIPVTWQRGVPRRGRLLVDHVDGSLRNNDPANLVPSCSGCNANRTHPTAIRTDEVFGVGGDGKRYRAERRRCAHCGDLFLRRLGSTSRYCSRRCSTRAMVKPDAIQEGELTVVTSTGARTRAVERECAKCGRRFLTMPKRLKEGRGLYCSRSCIRRKSA